MTDKIDKKIDVGGQALIEGVMMRAKDKICVAVRKPDNEIETDVKEVNSFLDRNKFFKLPIVRGVVAFFQSMIIGVKALMFSAEFFELEDEKPSKFEQFLENKFGDKIQDITIYFSVFVALIFGVFLFGVVPTLTVGLIKNYLNSDILATTIESILKIGIFVLYIFLISRLKDIKRVFEYHGAEHKSIFCYESGEDLTVENVRKHSRFHPRCGTSFLFIVLIITIIIFSFISWDSVILRVVYKIILLPVVAGISYEAIKYAGRKNNFFVKIISTPGLLLQRLTTREPDDEQIEVAIASINGALGIKTANENIEEQETFKDDNTKCDKEDIQ